MKLLLDTHTFLWFIDGGPSLSARARTLIEEPGNLSLIGIGSLWEISIKVNIGKLSLASPFADFIPKEVESNGMQILPISVQHLAKVVLLPRFHGDPFDRLLVAQAFVEGLPIVSADDTLDAYGVRRIW